MKRIISCLLIVAILVNMFPGSTAMASETNTNEAYSYVMFAGGDGESLTISTDDLTVNGKVHTNGLITANAKKSIINGEISAVSGAAIATNIESCKIKNGTFEETIRLDRKIKSTYFTDNCDIYESDFMKNETNININKAAFSQAALSMEGNVSLNQSIGAVNSVSVKGNSLNANNAVIYSENGNIDLKFDNVSVAGLIYAPQGKVIIDSTYVNINGIIIAKEIYINAQNVNINNNNKFAEFVGSNSESIYPEVVQLADGEIDGEYLYKVIYPNLFLYDISVENVTLADDYDQDGLSLKEEYDYDTNPFSVDTDEDGLDDFKEVKTYHTNPWSYDTDKDGMSDGTEVLSGLNPLLEDSDQNGVNDSDEVITQAVNIEWINPIDIKETLVKPEVEITGKGDFRNKLYVEDINYNTGVSD